MENSSAGPIQVFNDRELATVLHSLRVLQEIRNNEFIGGCWDHETHHVADPDSCDHFAEAQPLTNDEIDALCELLNLGDDKPRRVVIRVENGEAEILELPVGAEAVIIDYDELSSLRGDALESAIAGLPQDLQPGVREFFLGVEK